MSRACILVVEDEPLVAKDLRATLEERGYCVCAVARSGEEAIVEARAHKPDLVLMDIFLQGDVDGISAARIIQEELDSPVVYMSAYSDDETLERARQTQPFGYLTKPFREVELYCTIETAVFKYRMDREWKRSQQWLSVILNSIGDAVIATDAQDRVSFMNPVAESLTGWSRERAQGCRLEEVFRATDALGDDIDLRTRHACILPSLGSRRGRSTKVLTSSTGDRRLIEANESPMRHGDERPIGRVVVFRDVTECRISLELLDLLSQAVQQSTEGIAMTRLDGTILFVNRAFAEMHGGTQESAFGKNLSAFHTPEQLPLLDAANRKLLEEGMFSGEVWHARAEGTVFPGLMHNSVLRDDNGEPVALIWALRDITEIKRAEQALRASHEALEAYSSSLEAKVEARTKALEGSRSELKKHSESLEKTNQALRMVIESIDDRKKDVEKKIRYDVRQSIRPIIDQLKSQDVSETVLFLLQSLEFSLSNLFSSFDFDPATYTHRLTPREIRVCEMIRSGLSSKQVAKVMGISSQTVLVHRKNIRKKLNLGGSGQNLASFLRARNDS